MEDLKAIIRERIKNDKYRPKDLPVDEKMVDQYYQMTLEKLVDLALSPKQSILRALQLD